MCVCAWQAQQEGKWVIMKQWCHKCRVALLEDESGRRVLSVSLWVRTWPPGSAQRMGGAKSGSNWPLSGAMQTRASKTSEM